MPGFGRNARGVWFLLLIGAFAVVPVHAQQVPVPMPQQQQFPPPLGPPVDRSERQVLRKMAQERNVDRQKEIVADTDKLLALAKKLKEQVAKSDKDQLSLDVVDTANQIEKLAKSVKERMRDGT
ncbi:MAG: hypothetical protein WCA44_17245 [Acidobacteriaceae bacterium]|jgi:hypothetical protein